MFPWVNHLDWTLDTNVDSSIYFFCCLCEQWLEGIIPSLFGSNLVYKIDMCKSLPSRHVLPRFHPQVAAHFIKLMPPLQVQQQSNGSRGYKNNFLFQKGDDY